MTWSLQGRSVDGCYPILYADPPWSYKDKNPAGGAEAQYKTMEVGNIANIPAGRLAAPDAVLFMWATWPTLPDAFNLGRCWGFDYKNCGFLWAKTNRKTPTPFFGLGHWTRGNTEPCLLFTRGKPHRVDAAVEQLLISEQLVAAPLTRHSEKPPEVRDRIIKLMGDLPAIELFARKRATGWDAFGNEIPPEASVHLEAPNAPVSTIVAAELQR